MLRHYRNKHGITSLKRRDAVPDRGIYTAAAAAADRGIYAAATAAAAAVIHVYPRAAAAIYFLSRPARNTMEDRRTLLHDTNQQSLHILRSERIRPRSFHATRIEEI